MCFFPNVRIHDYVTSLIKTFYTEPLTPQACYFQFFDTLQLPNINGLFNFISVECQYGKRSERKQGESTIFVISIQTFSRERELSTQCHCYCHQNGNDITLNLLCPVGIKKFFTQSQSNSQLILGRT